MKKNNYSRYFRVFHNDTTITKISTNNFRCVKLQQANFKHIVYSLPEPLFYGYLTEAKAMDMAKAGSIAHINALIAMGKDGELALYEYRFDHYQDLTVNLGRQISSRLKMKLLINSFKPISITFIYP